MFKKILVAIDGSDAAKAALEKAIELNQSLHADIYILLVQKHMSNLEASMHMMPNDNSTVGDSVLAYSEQLVKSAKSTVTAANPEINVRGFIKIGPVARTIIAFAEERQIDLIVLGSRGHGDRDGFMLGSVSHKVTSMANIPVLVI
ncbi:universal stress protein [Ostreibacterium oceani]|uniref:Universal stress protein n=1 Tax=Ostreibacterium oceani TaxID=2654998 RepID=A0A6N7EUA5_9GAMM|nr:universal stress protein [Ostreibacterium oceani]MPV86012.1 universal stress protein [Ostreibacterium oceani]